MTLLDKIETQLKENENVKLVQAKEETFNNPSRHDVEREIYHRKTFHVAPLDPRNTAELLQSFMDDLFTGINPLKTLDPKRYAFGLRIGYLGFEEEVGEHRITTTHDYRFITNHDYRSPDAGLSGKRKTVEQTFPLFRGIDVYVYPNEKAAEVVERGSICVRGDYDCPIHAHCYRDFVPNVLLDGQSFWQSLVQRFTEDKEAYEARLHLPTLD